MEGEILLTNDILKPAEDIRKRVEEVKSKEVNIEDRVEKQLTKIAEYIDMAAKNGKSSIVVILNNEVNSKEEIYNQVFKKVLLKGYKAKITEGYCDNISISW